MTGVKPYPEGRKTETEWIEAGQQREQVKFGATKQGAITKGRQLRARMKTGGWKLVVWQNMGWHYNLQRGPITLNVSKDRQATVYWCQMTSDPKRSGYGEVFWDRCPYFRDPNRAVAAQIRIAERFAARLARAIAAAKGL